MIVVFCPRGSINQTVLGICTNESGALSECIANIIIIASQCRTTALPAANGSENKCMCSMLLP